MIFFAGQKVHDNINPYFRCNNKEKSTCAACFSTKCFGYSTGQSSCYLCKQFLSLFCDFRDENFGKLHVPLHLCLCQHLSVSMCVRFIPAAMSVQSPGSPGCQSAASGSPGRSSRVPSCAGPPHWGQR